MAYDERNNEIINWANQTLDQEGLKFGNISNNWIFKWVDS